MNRSRLTQVRDAAGMTLADLAAAITKQGQPISVGQLSRIEQGVRGASLETAIAIERVFETKDKRGRRRLRISAREIQEIPRKPREGAAA